MSERTGTRAEARTRRGAALLAVLACIATGCAWLPFRHRAGAGAQPPATDGLWFGEAYPDGVVILTEVAAEVAAVNVVYVFEAGAPWTARRMQSGPASNASWLFRFCRQVPAESYPSLARFTGRADPEQKEPRPVVAWRAPAVRTPHWTGSDIPPAGGWETKAREEAGSEGLGVTMVGLPLPLAGAEPGMFVEVRRYEKRAKDCDFPFVTTSVALDAAGKVLGTRKVDGCFQGAPFNETAPPDPCPSGDPRPVCRWPPAAHGGPYPDIFGPGQVPLALTDDEGKSVWIRHTWSFEGEHFLVERTAKGKIVTDADVYFYHCAF